MTQVHQPKQGIHQFLSQSWKTLPTSRTPSLEPLILSPGLVQTWPRHRVCSLIRVHPFSPAIGKCAGLHWEKRGRKRGSPFFPFWRRGAFQKVGLGPSWPPPSPPCMTQQVRHFYIRLRPCGLRGRPGALSEWVEVGKGCRGCRIEQGRRILSLWSSVTFLFMIGASSYIRSTKMYGHQIGTVDSAEDYLLDAQYEEYNRKVKNTVPSIGPAKVGHVFLSASTFLSFAKLGQWRGSLGVLTC